MDLNTEFFDITINQNHIVATSDFYIPFEISHFQSEKHTQIRTFKSALRTAIKTMQPQNGEILFAQYGELSEKNRFFDLENILFYNLEPSTFANCVFHGMSFSTLLNKDILCQQSGIKNRKYVYSYQCLPLSDIEFFFTNLSLMAIWNDIPLNRHETNSPAKYWKAIRSTKEQVTIFDYAESPITPSFALKIELYLPIQIKLANLIKPLLDGVICAFHGEDTQCLDCLNDFCIRHHCEELSIPNTFSSVLGKRNFIYSYRNGQSFRWNPADDLCKLALVTVSYGAKTPSFSGKIYKFS